MGQLHVWACDNDVYSYSQCKESVAVEEPRDGTLYPVVRRVKTHQARGQRKESA